MCSKLEIEQDPQVQAIRTHEPEMFKDKLPYGWEQCPKCGQLQVAGRFYRHEIRKRTFLVIIANLIHAFSSSISRWKCSGCKRTFTVYPPFALPYKQYTRESIVERSRAYVQVASLSYRKGMLENGRALYRRAAKAQEIDDRVVSHASLHRWISTLGQLSQTLRKALDMIKQAKPSCALFRELPLLQVHPRKHRSMKRRVELLCCAQLGMADRYYTKTFGRSIFPNLGTACAWT
jgi:transposase-like protein